MSENVLRGFLSGKRVCAAFGAALVILFSVSSGCATSSSEVVTEDWSISKPDLGQLHWGSQQIVVHVRNTSGDYQFLSVQAETRAPLRRFSAIRKSQSNYIFVPDEEKDITFVVDVLENLTFNTLKIGFYDVVDTLDDVSLGKTIYEDTFKVTTATPEGLVEFAGKAPRAGSVLKFNTSLNTDLSLLIHGMLEEPLTAAALTKRLGVPLAVVSRIMRTMEQYGFVRIDGNSLYHTTLTTIDGPSPSSVRALIDVHSGKMVEALKVALPKFKAKHQELMDAGLATKGKSATLDGSGMLHHLFPLVGGITLWEKVGSQFLIGGEGPAQVIDVDAPCNQTLEGYGYILLDGGYVDGSQFYFYDPASKRRVYGDDVPSVMCTRSSPSAKTRPSYYLPSKGTTLMYDYDMARIADVVGVLSEPLIPIRDEFSVAVKLAFKQNDIVLTPAHRYWLWNQMVSAVMGQLVADGVLEDGTKTFYTWREKVAR